MFYLALGLAIASSVAALYLRRDNEKARSWERVNGLIDERFAFVFLPAFAVALFGLVFLAAGNLSHELPVLAIILFVIGVPLTVVGAMGCIMGLFGTRYPQWLVPQWRRHSPYRTEADRPRRPSQRKRHTD